MKLRRGSSLLTTIAWLAVIATLGFMLASMSVQHLNATSSQENRQQALLLARSTISSAVAQLMENPDFGKASSPASDLLTVGSSEKRRGLLSFRPESAEDAGIAWSVNNFGGSTSVPGSGGRVVPENSAYLVAEGRCGGSVRRVEAVLAVPPFPYAVASAGPVLARNGVTIAGVRSGTVGPVAVGDPLVPADLLSNDSGGEAIVLGPGTNISGNVKANGTVKIDPGALSAGTVKVGGEISSNAAREKIPHIPLASYDPQVGTAGFTPLGADQLTDPAPLGGLFRRQGNLRVTNGLELDGGVLYVQGDLTVEGGITGKGMVVATGELRIQGQSDFQAGSGVAVLAGKDLSITGSDVEGSYLQGLVYTEGSFEADKVTLMGTMIAAGEDNPRPVVLQNARMLHQTAEAVLVSSGGPGPAATPGPVTSEVTALNPVQTSFGGRTVKLDFELVNGTWYARARITGRVSGGNGTNQGLSILLGSTKHQIYQGLTRFARKSNRSTRAPSPAAAIRSPLSFCKARDCLRMVVRSRPLPHRRRLLVAALAAAPPLRRWTLPASCTWRSAFAS